MPEAKSEVHSDPLFGTQKGRILEIWDRLQRYQSDFAFAQELTFFYTSTHWDSARTVLDLGTGNGYYLGKLAGHFPEKFYHGVDICREFITIAKKEISQGNVSFSHRNLFDVTDSYDFVLMRLLLQHLADLHSALNHVSKLTLPGGAALIIDAHDPLRFFHPPLPEFMEFFAAYVEHERRAGRDRCVASRIEEEVASSSDWRLTETLQLLIPSSIVGNLELFTNTYILLVDLVEEAGEFQYDFNAVREAWRRWAERPDAYTQVGLNLICIERI
jgi:SAM-dependent methyltransferase